MATSEKAETLCNFFSSVFNDEEDESFANLESKNCAYTSELPVILKIDDKS